MKNLKSKHIVFVTGAFVSHHGWREWQLFFEGQGYTTVAPPWPHKEGTAAELRALHPNNTALANLSLSELVDSYAKVVKSLPEKPILIGHSLGGLVTQILLNRDLAEAAIVLHSVPPLGVIPYEFSFLKAGWKSLGLFTSMKKTYMMSFKDWQYAFVNGMPLDEQRAAYEANTIPESKRVARGGLTSAAKVDFRKPHGPLLFIGGSKDHIIPASMNRRTYVRYTDKKSITEYQEFPNNHFVVGLPNWKETATTILNWIKS